VSASARSVLLAALAALCLTSAAQAATVGDADRVRQGMAWFANNQGTDGGVPSAGNPFEVTTTEIMGVLGVAAGGRKATELRRADAVHSYWDYVVSRQVALASRAPDIAALIMGAHATGVKAGEVLGPDNTNLIDELDALRVNRTLADGSANPDWGAFGYQLSALRNDIADPRSTAFASLALTALSRERTTGNTNFASNAAIAAQWLAVHPAPGGGWGPRTGAGDTQVPDAETTAMAIQALEASGLAAVPGSAATQAVGSAQVWLQSLRNPDGGYRTGAAGAPDSDLYASAAVALALESAGALDPSTSPLAYLGGLQSTAADYPHAGAFGTGNLTLGTTYALLAFHHEALPLEPPVAGDDGGGLPQQGTPVPLPTGPILPVETVPAAPAPTPSVAPAATTGAPAPTFVTPATTPAPAPATGVRRIKDHHKAKTDNKGDGDGGTGTAGSGSGSGGGGGTVATAGAPDRAGGGGGTGTALQPVPASVAGTPAPAQSAQRRGGTPTRSTNTSAREVSGTVIGRDSATPGAAGSRKATPGAAGASAGRSATPWWAIALAALLVAGLLTGTRAELARRRPELAL
jgi:hypothetical protein